MGEASIAAVLLDVFSLIQAGFELNEIVVRSKAMEDAGASPAAVASYIKGLRDAALNDLGQALKA